MMALLTTHWGRRIDDQLLLYQCFNVLNGILDVLQHLANFIQPSFQALKLILFYASLSFDFHLFSKFVICLFLEF